MIDRISLEILAYSQNSSFRANDYVGNCTDDKRSALQVDTVLFERLHKTPGLKLIYICPAIITAAFRGSS